MPDLRVWIDWMTLLTSHRCVRPRQRIRLLVANQIEEGGFEMLPRMAIRALRIAAAELVSVWIGVADIALTGDRDESPDLCVWIDRVTFLTGHCGMRPRQRIGLFVAVHTELRRFEMRPGMAFCAACVAVTELAAVRILMTALAHPRTPSVANCAGIRIPPFIGPIGDVALLAGHRHVGLIERESRQRMGLGQDAARSFGPRLIGGQMTLRAFTRPSGPVRRLVAIGAGLSSHFVEGYAHLVHVRNGRH